MALIFLCHCGFRAFHYEILSTRLINYSSSNLTAHRLLSIWLEVATKMSATWSCMFYSEGWKLIIWGHLHTIGHITPWEWIITFPSHTSDTSNWFDGFRIFILFSPFRSPFKGILSLITLYAPNSTQINRNKSVLFSLNDQTQKRYNLAKKIQRSLKTHGLQGDCGFKEFISAWKPSNFEGGPRFPWFGADYQRVPSLVIGLF